MIFNFLINVSLLAGHTVFLSDRHFGSENEPRINKCGFTARIGTRVNLQGSF